MASYYCRPSDILQPTWSVTSGTANSSFPVTNLGDLKPYKPFKATGTAATVRGTFGGSKTLAGVAFIMHNAAGTTVTISSGAGAITTLVFPANTADGLPVNAYKVFAGLSNLSSTTFDFAFTGLSANVAIGEILLIETVRTMSVTWDVKRGRTHLLDAQQTEYGVPLIYELGVRERTFDGRVVLESERTAMEELYDNARGASRAWWLVPDSTVNDCLYARFSKPLSSKLEGPRFTPTDIEVEEIGLGPAL
jgi:hypothetical protein